MGKIEAGGRFDRWHTEYGVALEDMIETWGSEFRPRVCTVPPFRILLCNTRQSFGHALVMIATASRICANFKESEATFIISGGPSFLQSLFALYPYPCELMVARTKQDFAIAFGGQAFESRQMVLPEEFANTDRYLADLGRGGLVVPDGVAEKARALLLQLGLKEDRWFCCMHYRDAGFAGKRDTMRDTDVAPYAQAVDYVIDELGGQVVMLGHPGMRAPDPRTGFVDLSRQAGWELLQAYAVSRSRFFVGGPSGPLVFPAGFDVPFGAIDQIMDHSLGQTISVTPTLHLPDGKRLRDDALLASEYSDDEDLLGLLTDPESGFRLESCGLKEISGVIDLLFKETFDTPKWRQPVADVGEKSEAIQWPPRVRRDFRFLPRAVDDCA